MGDIADRVGVMDAGQIVEEAPLDVLQRPFHPRPPRCPVVRPPCRVEAPILRDLGKGRRVACHPV